MIPLIFVIGLIIYLLSVVILAVTYAYRNIDPSPIAILVMLLPLVNTIAVAISFNRVNSEFMKLMHDLKGNKKRSKI